MFELTISLNVEMQDKIYSICRQLLPEIKKDGGICTILNTGVRCNLVMAVDSEYREFFKAKILDFVTNIIIDHYKYNYLKNSILMCDTSVIHQSFLKAISIFDSETDREFIREQLTLSGELLIDSFYYFKLEPLREKWAKTISVIAKNRILESNSSMIEVLKYLTTMSDNCSVIADINLCGKQIKLKNLEKNMSFDKDFVGISGFFTEIVKLNPMKINIKLGKTDNEIDEIMVFLNKIFSDKVYVLN